MRSPLLLAHVLTAMLLLSAPAAATAGSETAGSETAGGILATQIEVPTETFVLPNGLTVIVHEDHAAPLVHVGVWYAVGSKDEPAGKSGFAHLFEHLMFNGSEHFNDDFFKATQALGATSQNGTTNADRTNYFQTVPKAALDSILWLESDRMGHLLGVIDQARLDEQRAVVKNEKRQGDNAPYAMVPDLIMRAMMPAGHPYAHSTIGSMEDLDAATLEDVREWFRTYYGASNAVLVLAGDITLDEAKAKVSRYFGDITPGAPVSRPTRWVPRHTGTIREVAHDRVAQARLYRVWNVAGEASADTDRLRLLAQVLAGDRNSRLHKRLVLQDKLALAVGASVWGSALAGQFAVTASLKPGTDLARVEAIVAEELERLLETGPDASELARVRAGTIAGFVRSLESLSAKAALLADSQLAYGSADGWSAGFADYKAATSGAVRDAGRRWLRDGDYVLHVLPFGEMQAASQGADRSSMPMPDGMVPATFPAVERAILGNGMQLLVARREGVPLVNMTLHLKSGVPADYRSVKPGAGSLAMSALDQATITRDGEQLTEALTLLGATLESGGGGETSQVSLSALKSTLKEALAIYADVILRPAFAQDDIERLKEQMLTGIASNRQDPSRAASRITMPLLFGRDHAYGRLLGEADVAALERKDLVEFHARWFHPGNAAMVVTGDTTLAEIQPLIEAAFSGWSPGDAPATIVPFAEGPERPSVYLVDKPGTAQTVIRAALIAPPRAQGDAIARDALNTVVGGSFTSRLNMKLREEKGWAYGAGSSIGGGHGSQLFAASASVQTDRTAESMAEIARLLDGVAKGSLVTEGELRVARDDLALGLTGAWATSRGIARYIIDQVSFALPDDYYGDYPGRIAGISLGTVHAEADALFGEGALTWIVVGDRAKIEAPIRALGLGEVRLIDPDGVPVR